MILFVFLQIVKLALHVLEMAFTLVSLQLWLRHLNITQGVFCIDCFAWPEKEKKTFLVWCLTDNTVDHFTIGYGQDIFR